MVADQIQGIFYPWDKSAKLIVLKDTLNMPQLFVHEMTHVVDFDRFGIRTLMVIHYLFVRIYQWDIFEFHAYLRQAAFLFSNCFKMKCPSIKKSLL